jgi:hypothetical protein
VAVPGVDGFRQNLQKPGRKALELPPSSAISRILEKNERISAE